MPENEIGGYRIVPFYRGAEILMQVLDSRGEPATFAGQESEILVNARAGDALARIDAWSERMRRLMGGATSAPASAPAPAPRPSAAEQPRAAPTGTVTLGAPAPVSNTAHADRARKLARIGKIRRQHEQQLYIRLGLLSGKGREGADGVDGSCTRSARRAFLTSHYTAFIAHATESKAKRARLPLQVSASDERCIARLFGTWRASRLLQAYSASMHR
jgi:hypothetical protein